MPTHPDETDEMVDPTDLNAFVDQVQHLAVMTPAPARSRTGAALTLLQPHSDDCALSVGGLLLQLANPLQLVTVFSTSSTAEATATRQAEDRHFAELIAAEWSHLGHEEHRSTGPARSDTDVEAIVEGAGARRVQDDVVLAPAGVARHVDHMAVHQAARAMGATVLWEDVAFWSIYGASVEDRVLFSLRSADWLAEQVLVAVDITESVQGKAALLACYGSQSDERWRPLRYAWAAARELGRHGYCERLFMPDDEVEDRTAMLGLVVEPGPALQYGVVPVRTAWAVTR
jgi:LmbE family N-acetylglucosaminyl deacetylase